MPRKKTGYASTLLWFIALSIILNLSFHFSVTAEETRVDLNNDATLLLSTDAERSRAGKLRLPAAVSEAMLVNVTVSWEALDAEDIPSSTAFTMVPDGIAFMAVNLFLDSDYGWSTSIEVPMGTRSIQFRDVEIEGLDYRILGSVEEGYTIEYYPQGALPDDDAQLAEQDLPSGSIQLRAVPSQTVALRQTAPLIQTEEGESLTPEEYQERIIEAQLREAGYIVDKTPYIIGIAICVALIIVVIVIRILLGRH